MTETNVLPLSNAATLTPGFNSKNQMWICQAQINHIYCGAISQCWEISAELRAKLIQTSAPYSRRNEKALVICPLKWNTLIHAFIHYAQAKY